MKLVSISERHTLHIHHNRFSVYDRELRLFSFFVETPVNTLTEEDHDLDIELSEFYHGRVTWQAKSTLWKKKSYILSLTNGCFCFTVRVEGEGDVGDIHYFRGKPDSPGSAFGVAGYMLISAQNTDEARAMHLTDVQPATITPLRAAPPPFLFPFWNDYNDTWMGLGVVANAGEHNFQEFTFHAPRNNWDENGCWFTLAMEGYTKVRGSWRSPSMWGCFARSSMDTVRRYATWQYEIKGFAPSAPAEAAPDWWSKPIFCGWGQQCRLRDKTPGSQSIDFARQDIYRTFTAGLDRLRLPVGTVFIDDKWQKHYGLLDVDEEKWPDMRGFVEEQHACGRHVVLWFRGWKAEGLPEDECILKENGSVFSADPTNPRYLERLKKAVYHLLSPDEGCMNIDGFKLDFMDNHPRVRGMKIYEPGVFGLEIMKRLYDAIYRFAKAAKPDALINASCAHPYFAENCDQFRLHDFDSDIRNPISTMRFRADFAHAVMPEVSLDTDGFSAPTKYQQLRVLLAAARLGVPDLYFFPEGFSGEDWEKVRKAWEAGPGQEPVENEWYTGDIY